MASMPPLRMRPPLPLSSRRVPVSRVSAEAVAIVPAALRISPDCTVRAAPITLPPLLSSRPSPRSQASPLQAADDAAGIVQRGSVEMVQPSLTMLPRRLSSRPALVTSMALPASMRPSAISIAAALILTVSAALMCPPWPASVPASIVSAAPDSMVPPSLPSSAAAQRDRGAVRAADEAMVVGEAVAHEYRACRPRQCGWRRTARCCRSRRRAPCTLPMA